MAREEQIIKIKIETGQASKSVGGLNKELDKTSKNSKKTSKGLAGAFGAIKTGILSAIPALNAFKIALISTGVGAIVVAVGALVGVLAKAAGAGAEFGKALSGLKAVSGATTEEMEALSKQAKQLGASTAFTASEVVKLQTELAKLGFSARDIANSTPAILDLAASLDVDLASAAEFAGSVVRSFGLDTEDTQRVVDVMALSTASSALNFGALQESLKMAAPVMKATGQSVEKTAAMLGVLADTGIKGSLAGTGLSKTFIALNKEGISLEDAMAKVKGSTDQLGAAVDLVGVVGAKSLLNLANSGDKIAELEQTFIDAGGAAKDIAETRLDNLAGDTTKLGSAWEGFLLAIEDGDGIINKIQRGAIQFLTAGITALTKTIQFLDFFFRDTWEGMKEVAGASGQIIGGSFQVLGAKIKEFVNKALLQVSRIPIIGRAIDADAARKRIREAAKSLDEAEQKIREGRDRIAKQAVKQATFMVRFRKDQETKALVEKQKEQNAELEEIAAEQAEKDKEAAEKAAKQREKDLEKIHNIEKKYAKMSEDLDDITALAKAQRKRQRALEELEAIKLSEEEKAKAKKAINDYYDELEEKAAETDAKKLNEEKLKLFTFDKDIEKTAFDERRARLAEQRQLLLDDEVLSEEQRSLILKQLNDADLAVKTDEAKQLEAIEQKKRKDKYDTLDAVASVAGAESKVGQALLIAKQAMQLQETLMDLKRITFKGTQAVGEAGVNAAQNVSQSSKIGFPQNIITIAAAIGQGISIISSVKKAVAKTKAAGAGSATAPTIPAAGGRGATEALEPAFNVIGSSSSTQIADAIGAANDRPIKTYVTSNDVTSAQSMERNIVDNATIG